MNEIKKPSEQIEKIVLHLFLKVLYNKIRWKLKKTNKCKKIELEIGTKEVQIHTIELTLGRNTNKTYKTILLEQKLKETEKERSTKKIKVKDTRPRFHTMWNCNTKQTTLK